MMNTLLMLSRFANKTFALWVIIAGILGFVFPDVFKPIGSWIAILLGVMMFGMGLTLTTADFREIFRRPKDVFVGILAQFLIMPLAAFVLCKAFALPPDLAVGLMLLGCVPGGTASIWSLSSPAVMSRCRSRSLRARRCLRRSLRRL